MRGCGSGTIMSSRVRRKNGVVFPHPSRLLLTDGGVSGDGLRSRFLSMPTVEEYPDPEANKERQLRPTYSLPCDPEEVSVFPSLTQHMLADLDLSVPTVGSSAGTGLGGRSNGSSDKDLESKFSSLALAFKTDRLTLQERLEVQTRHRDQAEQNLDLEVKRFRDQLLNLAASGSERSDQLKSLQRQLDILKQISQRLSCTAEVLGAVQQEMRVSRAVEVMTQHVENLRHLYDREHAELEEARRLLVTNNIPLHETPPSAAGGAKSGGAAGRRRASIAVFSAAGRAASTAGLPSLPAPAPANAPPASLLKRRRNSLGGGDTDGFACISEEREDEKETEDRLSETDSAADEHPDSELLENDQLRTHVETAVSEELASLRSEQQQLALDLRTLLSRQRDAVLHQTTSVGNLMWDVMRAWPYSMVRARYCIGGLFLVLAFVVLLLPPVYTVRCDSHRHGWYSWAELLSPFLDLQYVRAPPV